MMARCCNQPDRDVPKLRCGVPLPCPYHTYTIDLGATPATVTVPVTAKKRHVTRASAIAECLSDGLTKFRITKYEAVR